MFESQAVELIKLNHLISRWTDQQSFQLVCWKEWTKEKITSLVIPFKAEEIIPGRDELPAADETVVVDVDGVERHLRKLGGDTQDVEILGEVLEIRQTIVVLINAGKVTIVDVVCGGEEVLLANLFEVACECF